MTKKAGPDVDRIHQLQHEPTPEHQRGGTGIPQRLPVPAPRPHDEPQLPRRTPGGSL